MKHWLLIFLLTASSGLVQSQTNNDFNFIQTQYTNPPVKKHEWKVAKNNKNEVQWIFSSLFLVYKKCFSSQDYNHCSFEPSCSEYAMISLKKQGLIIGIMDACDRLLRCNGMSPENYEFNESTGLLIDHP